jgi:site-specific DNA-methyltransferase (adenine-specific)
MMKTNVLYFGDNLEILRNREYFSDECIDLIYLDPPFNSKKDYNILFKENGGVESEAQIQAFTDSWHWTQSAQDTYQDIVTNGPVKVRDLIGALHQALGNNDVMAYLVMMTARLIELHRVLKSTGSLYLHCDPTASHYLKLVLDQIFGPTNFRNEIVWKRSDAHSDVGQGAKHYGRIHDSIFFYVKSDKHTFNKVYNPLPASTVENWYRYVEEETGRYFNKADVTAPGGAAKGNPYYDWKGIKRYWRFSKEKMEALDKQGLLVYSKSGVPYLKRYLDESKGIPLQCWWDDIKMLRGIHKDAERLGYETQKPLALLERIIQASSNEGDIVLDPFCGCGTAVVAAQKLNRKWIGIDITHLAIALMRNRLKDSFNIDAEVVGEPVDLTSARALAQEDRYQFQWWALSKVKARPAGEKKKGADKGIDGVIHFIDDPTSKPKRVVVQVKSGHVGVKDIRELETVAANEAIGVLITLEQPTNPMQVEAVAAGYYHSPIWDRDYPKIQILTIEELLHGKTIDMPLQAQTSVTFTKAQKISKKEGEQPSLEL